LNYNLYAYNDKAIAFSQQKSCYISISDDKRRENSRYIIVVYNDNEIKREDVIASNQNGDRCVYILKIKYKED